MRPSSGALRPTHWAVRALLLLLLAAPALLAPALVAPALPAASAEGAIRHAAVLSREVGPRPSGTPAFLRAADYVDGSLRAWGYTVERQPFPFLYFEVRGSVLRLVATGETIPTVVPEYSAATPPAGIEAALADGGFGRPEELQRVAGRIALVQRGPAGFLFRDKVANAAAAGAVAIIIYNHTPDPVPQVTLLTPARIPAVVVTQEAGQRLLGLLRQGEVRVHLRVETVLEERTTWNVVGRRQGRGGRAIVVGAHLDSVEVSPGANDNASGVAAVLEAARLLAGAPLELPLEVVAFGAEERGLLGSAYYVRQRGGQVAAMVNLDMVGVGVLRAGNGSGDGPLLEAAERVASGQGVALPRFRLPGGSDHASFERAGIPTVFLHTGDDPQIHTPGDVLERLDPRLLAQAAQLAAAVVLEAPRVIR
ncbi:MAG: M28 family metallopeptidase [Armatimonadota bacterium]|nr:M28 family metallopeptidase [Armatimonadota bacterium]MDR7427083.1 M28 family metallopeptidase [Armatimonadota bacterium]MDR7464902.1 M28 family metallopeptidase [Armatimonadota bacterium]MDR7471126.1 M28 family metallopeptidase [Armatimonadota bacterium]MDR7474149.1 M28 family metallopeptidase [Armatimonadota bacterium]